MAKDVREDVLLRLRKVEGQVRGLQRMIERGEDCTDVVHQLSAVRKALDKVGFLILSHRMRECVESKGHEPGTQADMDEAMRLFLSLS
jgi:CsoR family transcriptional regulator, copper-sensing transcriptional repressor